MLSRQLPQSNMLASQKPFKHNLHNQLEWLKSGEYDHLLVFKTAKFDKDNSKDPTNIKVDRNCSKSTVRDSFRPISSTISSQMKQNGSNDAKHHKENEPNKIQNCEVDAEEAWLQNDFEFLDDFEEEFRVQPDTTSRKRRTEINEESDNEFINIPKKRLMKENNDQRSRNRPILAKTVDSVQHNEVENLLNDLKHVLLKMSRDIWIRKLQKTS